MFPKERGSGGNREFHQEVVGRWLCKKIARGVDSVSDYELVFSFFDVNRDRKISLAELQNCMKAIHEELSVEDLEVVEAFLDSDELLGFDDFRRFVKARGNKEDKGQSFKEAFNVVDPEVSVPPGDEKFETRVKKLEISLCSMLAGMFTLLFYANGETKDVLPVSSNNLADAPLEQKAFTLKNFLRSVLSISPREHGFLLTLFGYFLSYFTKNSTTPFDQSQPEITTNSTPHSLVSFREAIFGFSPEIAHITAFMICYLINWILVVPLALRLRLFLIPLLFYVPFLYFPDLLRKASALRVHVACGGSFNQLPLIAFVTSVAFGITLVFVLVTLLVLYVRLLHGKTPTRSTQDEVILDEDDLNADVFV